MLSYTTITNLANAEDSFLLIQYGFHHLERTTVVFSVTTEILLHALKRSPLGSTKSSKALINISHITHRGEGVTWLRVA